MKSLIGKTITEIIGCEVGSDEVLLKCASGENFKMWHDQDCCESVVIEDICGDINHLIGMPILEAEELSNAKEPTEYEYNDDSHTWTFYRIATNRGVVVIRWLGESNGWYSESVEFKQVTS